MASPDPIQIPAAAADQGEGPDLRSDDVRQRVVRLAFDGDEARYRHFIRTLKEAIPPDVTVILRGSAVTGYRWHTDIPFDADGPGTSDLDLTLVSGDMVKLFDVHYIPGLHTAPLSDAHPDASATLHPLRSALCAIARRPVNIQATSNLAQFVRDVVMNQPYFTMIEPEPEPPAAT
jgi:predicted nucleotidyltransferase